MVLLDIQSVKLFRHLIKLCQLPLRSLRLLKFSQTAQASPKITVKVINSSINSWWLRLAFQRMVRQLRQHSIRPIRAKQSHRVHSLLNPLRLSSPRSNLQLSHSTPHRPLRHSPQHRMDSNKHRHNQRSLSSAAFINRCYC